jgi:hypothetical protein
MAEFFIDRGVRAKAVHSGPTSAARRLALQQLAAGEIDIIFSVDLFNEGVDVPEVDTVLMLRPTDSPVLFLQQLGRGLRIASGKDHLTVIDFIGNHRSFLAKPRTLLSLAGDASSTMKVIKAMETGEFGLPEGCSVSYDLESVQLLRELTRREQGPALARFCRAYHAEHGRRPTAVQAWRASYNPGSFRPRGWFGGLAEMENMLDETEAPVVSRYGELLSTIEKEAITKSYKLVTLEAFLDLGGLSGGVALSELADRSRYLMRNNPRLSVDAGDHLDDEDEDWYRYWRRWPVAAWTGELRDSAVTALFEVVGDRFQLRHRVAAGSTAVMEDLLGELVDYRLCRYLDSVQRPAGGFRLRVGQTEGRPLVWMDRPRNPGLPEDEVSLTVEGEQYVGLFRKIALNKVYRPPSSENLLPTILHRWFGDEAGRPGSSHDVAVRQSHAGWKLEPVKANDPYIGE